MITGIHHIHVRVHDLARSVRFYLALGVPVIPLSPTQAFVMTPNAGILLVHTPDITPLHTAVHEIGWRHLCLQVPDMAQSMRICETHALTMLSAPVDLRTGHLYVYGRHDDHTLIEIEEVPYSPYAYPCWLGHIACVSHDVLRLKHFYGEFIGGDVIDPGVLGPNPAYDRVVGFNQTRLHPVWVKRLNLTIELWEFVVPPSPVRTPHSVDTLGYQSVALTSDDITADIQRCIALGGTLIHASATYARMTDCDQNYLELYAPEDPFVRATGGWSHPTLLNENAAHWRPRPDAS